MVDLSNLYQGYLKASRFSGTKSADISRALKPYGIKLATVRKNKRTPDVSLRRTATKAVVKKYLRAKKQGKTQPLSGRG